MPPEVAINQVIAWIGKDPVRLGEIATRLAKEADPDLAFEIASNLPVPRHALRIKEVDPADRFAEVGFISFNALQAHAKKLRKINSEQSQLGEKEFKFPVPAGRGDELKVYHETCRDVLPFLRHFACLKAREADSEMEVVTYQELLQTAGGAALCVAHRNNERIDKLFLESLEEANKVSLANHEYSLLGRTPTFSRRDFETRARKAVQAQIQVKIAKTAVAKAAPTRTKRQQRNRRDAGQQ